MSLDPLHAALAALAALAAGFVNAIAGGGTLISFPALVFLGLPPVSANVTSTLALCPGYFGAAYAQRGELVGEASRLRRLLPLAFLGGGGGALLLLAGGEKTFTFLVPYLILLASTLLALQTPVRNFLSARAAKRAGTLAGTAGASPAGEAPGSSLEAGGVPIRGPGLGLMAGVAAAAVYGGYFGAGVSVVILALLGIALEGSLTRLNALKQALALAANLAAAALFALSGRVSWLAVIVMALGALAGGMLGGRLANRISPNLLRGLVVTLGAALGLYYLIV